MRSFVFATAFLALMLFAAVCPPATQAAPATLTVNFEIVNPDDFWATPIKNLAAVQSKAHVPPQAATAIYCSVGNSALQALKPNANNLQITTSSEAGSEVVIRTGFQGTSYGSDFVTGVGKFTVNNNGQTVTIRLSVPHVADNVKPPADVTMKLLQSQ